MLVTGMRGAGKTFWWAALQQADVRNALHQVAELTDLSKSTEVRTGFGIRPAVDEYPDKDILKTLISKKYEPRLIWRTVQAWQLADVDHPLRCQGSWKNRTSFVYENPEAIAKLFQDADQKFRRKGVFLLVLFDALDRSSDDWKDMYALIRGLMQTALDMRSYQRLRVKIFLRSDQVAGTEIADFPDASKVLSSSVELGWPARELYGLLWHNLINSSERTAEHFRNFLTKKNYRSTEIAEGQTTLFCRTKISL